MTPNDRAGFAATLTGMANLYGATLSREGLEAWWQTMQPWELADFRAAAAHLQGISQFMPRPADFNALRKVATPDAGQAWAAVLKHIRSGRYRDGTLTGNAVINSAVAALGGFKAIAFHDEDKLHFLERRFAEHFAAAQDRSAVLGALPHLAPPAGLPRLPDLSIRRLA